MESPLFDDVHAMVSVSKALVSDSATDGPAVAALERGTREHPNGTTETYERIEFSQ